MPSLDEVPDSEVFLLLAEIKISLIEDRERRQIGAAVEGQRWGLWAVKVRKIEWLEAPGLRRSIE